MVANYTYNAWGEVLTSTGNMAAINPLRYRGYYYDTETGFYYLQSRYYDPVTHRFINADSLASTGQGILGTNMFTYCLNNATNYFDSDGKDAIWIHETDTAATFGHSGLLVQDTNHNWYFFYWGPIAETFSLDLLSGTESVCIVAMIKTEGLDMTKEGDIIAAIQNSSDARISNRASKISSVTYFEGDYTETLSYLQKLSTDAADYNLLKKNCYQETIRALSKSNSSFSKYMHVWPDAGYFNLRTDRYINRQLQNLRSVYTKVKSGIKDFLQNAATSFGQVF